MLQSTFIIIQKIKIKTLKIIQKKQFNQTIDKKRFIFMKKKFKKELKTNL